MPSEQGEGCSETCAEHPLNPDGRFQEWRRALPACKCGRDTCAFNSRLARFALDFPAHGALGVGGNTVFSKPDPGSLADVFISSFSTWEAGRLAGWLGRQAVGARLPGVQIMALTVEIQNLRLTGMLPFSHL